MHTSCCCSCCQSAYWANISTVLWVSTWSFQASSFELWSLVKNPQSACSSTDWTMCPLLWSFSRNAVQFATLFLTSYNQKIQATVQWDSQSSWTIKQTTSICTLSCVVCRRQIEWLVWQCVLYGLLRLLLMPFSNLVFQPLLFNYIMQQLITQLIRICPVGTMDISEIWGNPSSVLRRYVSRQGNISIPGASC